MKQYTQYTLESLINKLIDLANNEGHNYQSFVYVGCHEDLMNPEYAPLEEINIIDGRIVLDYGSS